MAKENLKELSVEQLEKKGKSLKGLIVIFIPLIIGLFYFVITDYYSGKETNWSMLTITMCTLAGLATLYPELRKVQRELKSR